MVNNGFSTLAGDIAALCEQMQCLDIKVEEKVAKHSLSEEAWNLWHVKACSDDVQSSTNGLQIKTSEGSRTANLMERSFSGEACKTHHASCMPNINEIESSMENE